MTESEDIFAGCTTDEERLEVERGLIKPTDNSAREEDGPQPVIEDGVEVGE